MPATQFNMKWVEPAGLVKFDFLGLKTLTVLKTAVDFLKLRGIEIDLSAMPAIAGTFSFISGESYMRLIQEKWLGFTSSWSLPNHLDAWYYWLVEKGHAPLPKLAGVDIRQLALSPGLDFAMIGAGGLMGMRVASSLLLGALLNFVVVAPIMISLGEIQPREGSIAAGTAVFGRAHILNNWALWYGITMMVVASLVALFAKPEIFVAAFKSLRRRRNGPAQNDVLRDIELPLVLSWIGVTVFGLVFTPVFYVLIRALGRKPKAAAAASPQPAE